MIFELFWLLLLNINDLLLLEIKNNRRTKRSYILYEFRIIPLRIKCILLNVDSDPSKQEGEPYYFYLQKVIYASASPSKRTYSFIVEELKWIDLICKI